MVGWFGMSKSSQDAVAAGRSTIERRALAAEANMRRFDTLMVIVALCTAVMVWAVVTFPN